MINTQRGAGRVPARLHARPFVGFFKGQFLTGLSTFGTAPHKMAPKPSPNPKTVPWDNPTKGLLWCWRILLSRELGTF